jgi:hypothetical protein
MALAHARPHAHVRAFCPAHAWEPEFSSWAGTGLTSVRVLVQYSRLFPLLLNPCIVWTRELLSSIWLNVV